MPSHLNFVHLAVFLSRYYRKNFEHFNKIHLQVKIQIPTNVCEETELVAFYDELSSLRRNIPKHKDSHWRRHECPNREKRKLQIQPTQHVK